MSRPWFSNNVDTVYYRLKEEVKMNTLAALRHGEDGVEVFYNELGYYHIHVDYTLKVILRG